MPLCSWPEFGFGGTGHKLHCLQGLGCGLLESHASVPACGVCGSVACSDRADIRIFAVCSALWRVKPLAVTSNAESGRCAGLVRVVQSCMTSCTTPWNILYHITSLVMQDPFVNNGTPDHSPQSFRSHIPNPEGPGTPV